MTTPPAPVQPRVLSPAHARGHREAARDAPAARAAEAGVLFGDLRRRRLDARRHARDGARVPRRRHGRRRRTFRAWAARARRSREVLAQYKAHGIRHVVALRGDLPSGSHDAGDFRYASELVAFIRRETGDWFHIDVAAYPEYHPQARSPQDDLVAFKRKVDAGADSAITQYFYNPDAYWHFVDACRGAGVERADRPRHHADRQLREARALLRRLRRRDSALDAEASSKATATTPRRSGRSDWTWSRNSPTACSPAARRGCTSTR